MLFKKPSILSVCVVAKDEKNLEWDTWSTERKRPPASCLPKVKTGSGCGRPTSDIKGLWKGEEELKVNPTLGDAVCRLARKCAIIFG